MIGEPSLRNLDDTARQLGDSCGRYEWIREGNHEGGSMLRRVVKRAIKARRNDRKLVIPAPLAPTQDPQTTSHHRQREPDTQHETVDSGQNVKGGPTTPADHAPRMEANGETDRTPAVAETTHKKSGIAARIAAGDLNEIMPLVSATSGAQQSKQVEINTAEDGETYWGPIDNESARAKARGDALIIDQWECISCGVCVENTDAVFTLPDDAKAVVIRQEGDMALIQDALDSCPVTCIHWTDEPAQFEQTNDAEGNPV